MLPFFRRKTGFSPCFRPLFAVYSPQREGFSLCDKIAQNDSFDMFTTLWGGYNRTITLFLRCYQRCPTCPQGRTDQGHIHAALFIPISCLYMSSAHLVFLRKNIIRSSLLAPRPARSCIARLALPPCQAPVGTPAYLLARPLPLRLAIASPRLAGQWWAASHWPAVA